MDGEGLKPKKRKKRKKRTPVKYKSAQSTAPFSEYISMTESRWISAFQSNLRISDHPNPSTSDATATTSPYIGQISSFVFLVAGLEKRLQILDDTPIIFDSIDTTFGTRTPIASGASSLVERASWKNNGRNDFLLKWGEQVTLKYVRQRRTGNADWKHILLEMRALMHEPIRYHPNIVRMIGLSWGAAYDSGMSFPVLVLELADCGTLEHLQINEQLPFHIKKKLCWDVSKGLSILHASGIVHGDLKHENVLVFRDKREDAVVPYIAKLADFGGSVMDLEEEGSALHMGTPPYDAPEARNQQLDSEGIKRTDIYSLGLLVWRTLLDGVDPFSRTNSDTCEALTPAEIDELKQSASLLPIAKEGARTCSDIDRVGLELIDFVLENTIQPSPRDRCLVNAVAGLQAKSIPEISELISKAAEANRQLEKMDSELEQGRRGITLDTSSLYVAILETGTYDFQHAGPGHRPVLKIPDPTEVIFDPQRLRRLLSWDIQREIFNDLTAVADARPDQHATHISNIVAAFFVFQCYCHEFGTTFDAVQACYWLKRAALSEDECQENYLAQAWCWRVHRALGIPLEVEHSIIRNWILLSIIRGHRKCIKDAMTILESLNDPEERTAWQSDVEARLSFLNRHAGGVGMPYFSPRKLLKRYDLLNLNVLDRDIQEEFQLRGITSIDKIFVNQRGDGLLHYAASMGNYPALRHLVTKYQPDINLPGREKYETPLLCACKGGHLTCALFLLDRGATPDGSRSAQETALYWLCAFSEAEMPIIADRLIRAGARIDNDGDLRASRDRILVAWADFEDLFLLPVSPLSRAVMMESLPAVRTLLALGANPLENYEDYSSICPIVLAAVLSLPTILETMLSHLDASTNGTPGIFDEIGMLQNALDLKATIHDPMTLQSRLTRLGEQYQSAVDDTLRILHDRRKAYPGASSTTSVVDIITRLVKLGREDLIRSLLELGHSIRGHPEYLIEAVKMNHEPIFRLLLKYGANVEMTKPGAANLLQMVAEGYQTSRPGLFIAEHLVEKGLPVNPPKNGSRSPFVFAVMKQQFELADFLLQHGANMDFYYSDKLDHPMITVLGDIACHPTPRNVESLKYLLNVDDEGNSLVETSRSRVRGEQLPSFVVCKELGLTALHFVCKDVARTELEKQSVGKIVRLMLSVKTYHDAINYCAPNVGPALLGAVVTANLEAVNELLEKGADVNISYQNSTPLLAIQVILRTYPDLKMDNKVLQQHFQRRYNLVWTLFQSRGLGI